MRSLKLKQSQSSSVPPPVVSPAVSGSAGVNDLGSVQQEAAANATDLSSSTDTETLKPAPRAAVPTGSKTDGINHKLVNSKLTSGPNPGLTNNPDKGQAFAEHALDGGRSPVQQESASSFFSSSSPYSSTSSSSSSSSSALSSSSSTNTPATNCSGGSGGSSSSSSNMTAFLSKLWRMVNDNHNDDQIRWSQSGCSFVIINQIQFAKDMLPIYFKHSNMASFIRQLNMYGFRKIPLMGSNGFGDQRVDVAQFYHVNFMRGQEQRLASIKRKDRSNTVRKRRMKFAVSQEDFGMGFSGADSGQDNSDVLFNMTANEADDGLFQMGEFRGHSSNGGGGANLDSQNLNHNHHHHHHYYNATEGGQSRPMELDDVESSGGGATFVGRREQLDTLALQRGLHLVHENQTLAGTSSRRASSVSMASVSTVAVATTSASAPTTTGSKQLFELAPASSSHSIAVSSSPSVLMFSSHSVSRNGKSDCGNSNPSLPFAGPAAPLNSPPAARAAEDELVPNGATAASMMATETAPIARKPSLSGNQFHSTSNRASLTPPKSNHSKQQQAVATTAAAAFKLNQLDQENISKSSDSSSISIANQHYNHLQMRQPQQQQQQQHSVGATSLLLQQSTTATGQQRSNSSSSICYATPIPMQFQANGRSCDGEGSSQQHLFNNHQLQQQHQVSISFANDGQNHQQSGRHIDNQRRQHLAQQQQHIVQLGARSVGANQTNALLNNRQHNQQQQFQLQHHSSFLGDCQHQMSRWTANSIYNTMAQQDLATMGPVSMGGSNGFVAGSFSNVNGVFNELRSRPDFLSALEQHHNQQMGGAQQQVAATFNSNESNGGTNSTPRGQNILGVSMNVNQVSGGRLSATSSGSGQVYYQ